MQRVIDPEWLDTLPHDDRAAIKSRKELRLINWLMGNERWIEREMRRADRTSSEVKVLELGAGEGRLSLRLLGAGLCQPRCLTAIDLAPAPSDWPREAVWRREDLFTIHPLPDAEIVVANLFLHHFRAEQLRLIGERLPASCRLLLFNEPARRQMHLWQGRLLSLAAWLSPVTRHDMAVSIRAGFLHDELEQALDLAGWRCQASMTWLGAYRFRATR